MADFLEFLLLLGEALALAYLWSWNCKFRVAIENLWNQNEILRRGHDDLFAGFKVIEAAHNQLVDELEERGLLGPRKELF